MKLGISHEVRDDPYGRARHILRHPVAGRVLEEPEWFPSVGNLLDAPPIAGVASGLGYALKRWDLVHENAYRVRHEPGKPWRLNIRRN